MYICMCVDEGGQLWIGQETKFGELEGKCRKLEEEDGCLRLEAKVGWFRRIGV